MRRFCFFLACLLSVLSLASCGAKAYSVDFFAFDTYNYLRVYSEADRGALSSAQALCLSLEKTASAYDPQSMLSQLNQTGGGQVDSRLIPVLRCALSLRQYTNGAFDPTLLRVSQLWSIGKETFRVPEDAELAEARGENPSAVLLGDNLILSDCLIDLGGILKGYACDAVLADLRESGVRRALISLGGNIGVFSDGDPFSIGIADPNSPSRILGVLTLSCGIVSVSGSYERFSEQDGVRYSHVLNPADGRPLTGDLSCAVVIGQDGALCDAVSTALLVMGFADARTFAESHTADFSVLLIRESGETYLSESLKESFVFEND